MKPILSTELGKRYGAWTITKEAEPKIYGGKKFRQVVARCECGAEKVLHYNNLRQGKSTKCFACSKVRHGLSDSPEHYIWDSMLARCNNPKSAAYANYGARGVSVCSRWDPLKGGSFDNFIADMGRRPSPRHQLDKEAIRLDSLEYSPETTRWALPEENYNRKRNNRRIYFNGECLTMAQWSRRLGIGPHALHLRLREGWSIERALTTPNQRFIWIDGQAVTLARV